MRNVGATGPGSVTLELRRVFCLGNLGMTEWEFRCHRDFSLDLLLFASRLHLLKTSVLPGFKVGNTEISYWTLEDISGITEKFGITEKKTTCWNSVTPIKSRYHRHQLALLGRAKIG